MFWTNKQKIFPGWPKTTCNQDKREVKISAVYLTPEGAKWRDNISSLLTTGSIIGFLIYQEGLVLGWPHFGIMVLGLVVAHYLIIPFFLKARVWIIFAEDYFKIRTLFSFWKEYDRGRDGYAFNQKFHEKRLAEPVIIGKNHKSYFEDAHQISLDHYQGFLILPGIYELEKSHQLFNRLIGVELWMSDLMPRIWGPRTAFESNTKRKERGFIMSLVRKFLTVMFFLYGFFGCAFLFTILFLCIPMGAEFIFGPEAEEAVFKFLKNLPNWAHVLGFLSFISLCIYAGVDEARKLNKRFLGKKEGKPEDNVIDIEFVDPEPKNNSSEKKNRFATKALSLIFAIILFLFGSFMFIKFFQITKEEVLQTLSIVPEKLQSVVVLIVGLLVIYIIKRMANNLESDMERNTG
ncbi:MAG: hypothetical protein ACE5EK_00300 [Nitrospinales bacterium]